MIYVKESRGMPRGRTPVVPAVSDIPKNALPLTEEVPQDESTDKTAIESSKAKKKAKRGQEE